MRKKWSMPLVVDKIIKDNSLKQSFQAAFILAMANMGDAFLYAWLPSNYQTLGISIVWVSVLLSINRFTRLLLNGWTAWQLSKIGIRPITIIATIISLLTTISYGFINSIPFWIITRILWGLAFSTLRLGSIIYAIQHHKKGVSLGLSRSLVEIGSVMSLALGPILINYFDRSYTFLILGLFTSLGVCVAFLMPNIRVDQVKRKDVSLSFPSSFNTVVFLNGLVVEGLVVVLLSRLLMQDFNLSPETMIVVAGFYLAYRRACLVIFSPIAGWFADRWGFSKVFNFTSLLLTVGILLIGLDFVIPGVILAFTFSAMNASVSPGTAAKREGFLIKEISDNATWRDIGAAVGTLIGGLLLGFSYLQSVFAIASVLLISGLVLLFNHSKKAAHHGIG
jgi:MFS transporter, DHA1 family, multidrug resistance protein